MSSPTPDAAAATTTNAPETVLAAAAAAAAAPASSSVKRPMEGGEGDAPDSKKIKTEEKGEEPVTEASAFAWFKQFFLTRHMLTTKPELFDALVDETHRVPSANERYDAYAALVEKTHSEWKERNDKFVAKRTQLAAKAKAAGVPLSAEDQGEKEPPSTPLSQAAWLFWTNLLSELVLTDGRIDTIKEWSGATIRNISEAFPEFVSNGSLNTDEEDRVNDLIDYQASAVDDDRELGPDSIPIAMLLKGIVTKTGAAWLSDEDLARIALAHGSKATTREKKLRDIFIEQVKMCREFVDRRFSEDETSHASVNGDFCVVRAILENSRKALGIRTLVDERPRPVDRKPVPVASLVDSGYATIKCAQCDADAVVLASADDSKDKDKVEIRTRALNRFCEACWNLPVGWRALLTAHDE